MKRLLTGLLLTGLIAVPAVDADAGTILPTCGTCGNHNTAWDLTLELIDDTNNLYRVTVTATYGSPVDFVYVNAIAVKVDAFVNNHDATPTVTGPAEATWSVLSGGISSGGCSGSGNGFYCANSVGIGATPGGAGSTDTWVFLLNINNNLANVTSSVGSFKAQFIDIEGGKVGDLISEAVTFGPPTVTPPTTTPEPATLLLFGTGLAAAATALRRRKKSS